MKLSNLLKRDLDVVGNKKIIYIIPAVIVGIAIIMGIVFGFWKGTPINFGMDFTGGYTVNVQLATKLTDDNYDDYVAQIEKVFDELTDGEGNNYGLSVSSTQHQGAEENASIYVRYQAVKAEDGTSQALMEQEINPKLIEKLNELFGIAPQSVTYVDGAIKAVYLENISDRVLESIKNNAVAYFDKNTIDTSAVSASISESDPKTVIITAPVAAQNKLDELKTALTVNDIYSGQAIQGDMISATVSGELLTNAIFAIVLALVLMLLYIALRFELSSGLSAIVALMHDLIIMFSALVIFHIEINSTFIAALITILGYSINNTIIIFDRVRENTKLTGQNRLTAANNANKSVNETLLRSINTAITTLITISCIAIIGVQSIRVFALPIIVGLLAGTYSSIFIAPSIWASWKGHVEKKHATAGDAKIKRTET